MIPRIPRIGGCHALFWARQVFTRQLDLPRAATSGFSQNVPSADAGRRTPCLIIAVLFLSLTLSAAGTQAATYYVDATGGSDTNDGLSPTKAWKTLEKVNNFSSFAYGDQLLLKSGGVWSEDLLIHSVGGIGSTSNRFLVSTYGESQKAIIFAGGIVAQSASQWSDTGQNGEYKIPLCHTTECTSSTIFVVRAQPAGMDTYKRIERGVIGTLQPDEYLVSDIVNGWRYLYYKPLTGSPSQYEFAYTLRQGVTVTRSYVTVENLKVLLGGYPWKDAAILATDAADYTVFKNCETYFGHGVGISLKNVKYSEIDGCIAKHNRGTGIYIQGDAMIATNNTIRNSESAFSGAMQSDPLVNAGVSDRGGIGVQGSGSVITKNVVHDNGTLNNTNHLDAAIHITANDSVNTGLVCCGTIAYNQIYNSAREAIQVDGPSWDIYSNVIYHWGRTGEGGTLNNAAIYIAGLGLSGDFKVDNNTLYSNENLPIIGMNFGMPTSADFLQNMNVTNNIIYMPGTTQGIGIRINRSNFSGVVDYNLVTGASTLYSGSFPEGSNTYSIDANPLFVDSAADDFHLQSGSPAIDAGTDAGLTESLDGTPVPDGIAPDMGAFEYSFVNPADTTRPVVKITSPANSASVSGKVNVSITASDNVGVTQLKLYIDDSLKAVRDGESLSYKWNTSPVATGLHTITAVGQDAAGNTATTSIQVIK